MPTPNFEEVVTDFRKFREMVGQAMTGAGDSPAGKYLADVVKSMDEQFAQLVETYPKAQAELDQRITQVKQRCAETQRSLDESKVRLAQALAERQAAKEAAAAAAAAPPAPPPPPPPKPAPKFDPGLATLLRAELLQRFGFEAEPGADEAEARRMREAWEDWQPGDWEPPHRDQP